MTTPRIPAHEMTAAALGWNLPSPSMNLCCSHLNGKTQTGRRMMTVPSTARQVQTMVPHPGPVSLASETRRRICMPSIRKTTFSRMNWIVDQLIRSLTRDDAFWTIGDLWPRSSPATTTASTPDPW